MIIKSKLLAIIVFVVMFGGIYGTSLLGWWNTGTSKEPSLITSGEAAGRPDPADIRGSYNFSDIEKSFAVPATDLGAAFNLPAGTDAATFQVKGLETLYEAEAATGKEIGADSVRLFVADYTGLPFTAASDIWLPGSAVDMLKKRGNLTAEQAQYLDAHRIEISGSSAVADPGTASPAAPALEKTIPTAAPATGSTPAPAVSKTEPAADARIVTGSTTFQQVLDWGVKQAAIEKIIEGPMPDPAGIVKDYITGKGLEFAAYKSSLQVEVDKSK